MTVLLVADIGTFTGTAEGFYYSQALQNTTTLDPGAGLKVLSTMASSVRPYAKVGRFGC